MTLAPTLSGGLLIGGDRITEASGGTHSHIYPATGQPNAIIPLAGAAEIDRAVASAWQAHREWMTLTVDRRRDLLIDLADAVHENLDELARLNVHDYAVPISFAGNAIPLELGLLAMAMAMQGETVSRIGTVTVQTVVVTNNLLHFADALVGRFLSAPAATVGQGTHPRPTATEVAIPGCAWASYSIGACAGALAIVTVRAPLLFPILVVVLLVVDMLLHAESKPIVQMAGASPMAGRSGG